MSSARLNVFIIRSNPSTIHHVALYVGAGWMIQAPHTGDVVRFSRIYLDGYIGATRLPGV